MEDNTETTREIFNNTKGKGVKAHYEGGGTLWALSRDVFFYKKN